MRRFWAGPFRKHFGQVRYAVEKCLFYSDYLTDADSKIIHKYNLITSNRLAGICPYFQGVSIKGCGLRCVAMELRLLRRLENKALARLKPLCEWAV